MPLGVHAATGSNQDAAAANPERKDILDNFLEEASDVPAQAIAAEMGRPTRPIRCM